MKPESQHRVGARLVPYCLSAALVAGTFGAPAPARAEPTLTAVAAVTGAVALGSMLWMTRDRGPAQASSTEPGVPPPYVTQPYAMAVPAYSTGAVIYSSVSPLAQPTQPPGQPMQVATAPVAYYAIPAPGIQLGNPVAPANPAGSKF